MAGMPLLAGFVSKWYLVIGAIDTGQAVFAAGLLLSGILNVAYFWPIVYQAFFESEDGHDAKPLLENPIGGRGGTAVRTPHPDDETDALPDGGTDILAGDVQSAKAADHEESNETTAPPDPEHVDHVAEDHHGGPPPGGWDRVGWRGGESTWFMLGPILTAATGAVLIGVVPGLFVFLRIVTGIVRELPGVAL
jgi:NADH-quinone oxidoreductase subunit L/multicomponent Na+:H+ antiporter subunit D